MGYYITTDDSRITVLKKNLSQFFSIVNHLMQQDTIRKYSPYGNPERETHYSWIDTKKVLDAVAKQDMIGVFAEWRYEVRVEQDDDHAITFNLHVFDMQKLGDEEIFFTAIAPVIENDSFMDVRGEDGHRWQWSWNNGKFYAADEVAVSYSKPQEMTLDGWTL